MIYPFAFCVIWTINTSCADRKSTIEEPTNISEVNLKSENTNKTMPLSELYTIEQYIPLITGDSVFIGEISKLIIKNNNFWILDRITSKIFGFSKEGKLFTLIDREGEGPGRYQRISDIAISDDAVFIFDAFSGTMYEFGLNGEFIGDKQTKVSSSHMELLQNGGFVFYHDYIKNEWNSGNKVQYNLTLTDENLKVTKQILENKLSPEPEFLIGNQKNFSRNNSSLLVFESYQNTVYKIENDSVKPYLKYSLSNNESQNIRRLFQKTNSMFWSVNNTIDFENENEIKRIVELQENNSIISMTYLKKNFLYLTFYNKENSNIIELQRRMTDDSPPIALTNDIDNTTFYPLVVAQGDYFYSYTDVYQLNSGNIYSGRTKELLSTLPHDPNPILVKIKIKDF